MDKNSAVNICSEIKSRLCFSFHSERNTICWDIALVIAWYTSAAPCKVHQNAMIWICCVIENLIYSEAFQNIFFCQALGSGVEQRYPTRNTNLWWIWNLNKMQNDSGMESWSWNKSKAIWTNSRELNQMRQWNSISSATAGRIDSYFCWHLKLISHPFQSSKSLKRVTWDW